MKFEYLTVAQSDEIARTLHEELSKHDDVDDLPSAWSGVSSVIDRLVDLFSEDPSFDNTRFMLIAETGEEPIT